MLRADTYMQHELMIEQEDRLRETSIASTQWAYASLKLAMLGEKARNHASGD